MKWGVRAVFFAMLAVGILFGIGLPKAVERLPGYEIARLTLYSADAGFTPAQVMLAPPEAPFFLTLAARTNAPLRAGEDRAAITLTLHGENGETIFEQAFSFPNDPVLEADGGTVYREMVVVDRPLDGRHTAAVDVKPRLDPSVAAIELAVNAGAFDLDPRLQPAGFILLIVGGIGLVLSYGRREEPPPPPKWGRDAA